jgi:hypothetical protein
MKKNTISLLAVLAAFSITATSTSAQITVPKVSKDSIKEAIAITEEVVDDTKDQEEFLDRAVKDETVEMAQPEEQNITIDGIAPLGSEILLLSILGGAYLIGKKRKEEE